MSNEHGRQSQSEALLEAANKILTWAKDLAKGCPDHPEYHGAEAPDFKCPRCLQVWVNSEMIEDMKRKGLIKDD
jgi:hypothetical protein